MMGIQDLQESLLCSVITYLVIDSRIADSAETPEGSSYHNVFHGLVMFSYPAEGVEHEEESERKWSKNFSFCSWRR